MEASGSRRYVPLASSASWAKRLLIVAGLVDMLAVITGLAAYRLADRVASGSATFDQFNVSQVRHDLVILTQMTVYLVTAVVFIRWFHRAYANLPAIGIDGLGHRVPWAIGAWFVPIVSLVWPKQITDEIWQGSDPLLDAEESRNWRQGKVPVLIGMWWLAFITSSLLVVVGWHLWGHSDSYADIKRAAMIEVTGNAIAVFAGVLAYVVVDRLSERQQARAMRVAVWRPLLSHTS